MGNPIEVLVADESEDIRNKLKENLEDTGKIKVIGMAENDKEAVSLFEKLHPHAVVLDIRIPEKGGIETAIELYERDSAIPIIILRDYPMLKFNTHLKSKHIVFLDKSKEFKKIPKLIEKLCRSK